MRIFAFIVICCLSAASTLLRQFGNTSVLRDPEYGTPIILGGDVKDAFRGLGYAHATDRLWQLWLRYVSTTGRLAEFFGPGADNINIESDLEAVSTMYTDSEIIAEFETSFTDVAKAAYIGFTQGIQDRVFEVLLDLDNLLPYEFVAQGMNTVPNVFTLETCLHYSLATMRGLCHGHYPTTQLEQLDLLSTLQQRLGNTTLAQAAFDDLRTHAGMAELLTTVIPDEAPFVRHPSAVTPLIPTGFVALARKVTQGNSRVVEHRLSKGMMTLDGSWAMVVGPSRSTSGHTLLQGGPQDPMTFPTTFYEAYMDAPPFQAHFFTEPGCPLNQIYGVFGNFTAGRNRGYLPANDFRFEGVDKIYLHHNATILVAGGEPIIQAVYRSKSGGFVVSEPDEDGTVLTLRSVFVGRELRSLSWLIDFMLVSDVEGLKALLASSPDTNSDLSHSFVAWGDHKGNIAAFENGLWTELPKGFDRRLPQNISGFNLPPPYSFEDVVRSPVVSVNHPQGFYAGWNSPFNSSLPWFDYRYGGYWRSQWIADYLVDNSPLSFDAFKDIVQHQQRASSMGLGGNSDWDPFPRLFRVPFAQIVRKFPTPARLEALRMLDDYTGLFVAGLDSWDVKEDYMLANAWLYRVFDLVFGNLTTNTSSALPPLDPRVSLAVPWLELRTTHRFPQLLHNVLTAQSEFDWLASVNISEAVVAALDSALAVLGPSPWGKNLRLNFTMDGVGGVLGTLGFFPAGQCQSLNLAVELSPCGPVRVDSVVPFGVSGYVHNDKNGTAYHFDPHSRNQFGLFINYSYRPAFPRRFAATLLCEAVAPTNYKYLYWLIPVSAVVVLVLLGSLIFRRLKRKSSVSPEYVPVAK